MHLYTGRLAILLTVFGIIAPSPDSAGQGTILRTDIPFGNVANARVMPEGSETVVRFTAHPHGGPERLWFCFRVETDKSELGKVRLVLEGSETMLGGGRPETFRPVYRPAGGDWQRTGAPDITVLPDGRKEAAWTIDGSSRSADFAFCYPYGTNELNEVLHETDGYWRADTIGVSQGGRPLMRLSNDYGGKAGRPGLYLLARQHSGEVSGSWVLDGVLRRFAELGEKAPLVWVVPLANVDGVEQGDYGKDNFPYDLNRAWGNPPMRHEILVLQQDVRRWAQRCKGLALLDFHAPGGSESAGIFVFLHESEKRPEVSAEARRWAEVLNEALGKEFAARNFFRSGDYNSRWNTPRASTFALEEIGLSSIAIETPYAIASGKVLTREGYREAGRRIADTLARKALAVESVGLSPGDR